MSDKEFLKQTLSFKRKPAKMGPAFVFTIPIDWIRSGWVDKDQEYEIFLVPVTKNDDDEKDGISEKSSKKKN